MNKDKNTLFKTTRTLTFRDMDPAKIMFFGHIFDFTHDAYEQFVMASGFSWKEYFESADFAVPIRFSESDFRSPLLAGETYEISVSVCSFGHTSFKMKYIFSKGITVYAVVHLVHTIIDLKTKQKAPIPDIIRQRFEKYLEQKDSNSLP